MLNRLRSHLTNLSGILKDLKINSFLQGGVRNTSWDRLYPLESRRRMRLETYFKHKILTISFFKAPL